MCRLCLGPLKTSLWLRELRSCLADLLPWVLPVMWVIKSVYVCAIQPSLGFFLAYLDEHSRPLAGPSHVTIDLVVGRIWIPPKLPKLSWPWVTLCWVAGCQEESRAGQQSLCCTRWQAFLVQGDHHGVGVVPLKLPVASYKPCSMWESMHPREKEKPPPRCHLCGLVNAGSTTQSNWETDKSRGVV